MKMLNLKKGKTSTVRIKKGMSIRCLSGTVWMTASGEDYILHGNDEVELPNHGGKAVLFPVSGDAEIAVSPSSFFKEFSMFNKQIRLSGSFAG